VSGGLFNPMAARSCSQSSLKVCTAFVTSNTTSFRPWGEMNYSRVPECFQGPHNYVSAVAQRSNHRTLTQQLSGELMRQAWFDLGEEFLAIVLNDTGFILVERSNQCFQCYSG